MVTKYLLCFSILIALFISGKSQTQPSFGSKKKNSQSTKSSFGTAKKSSASISGREKHHSSVGSHSGSYGKSGSQGKSGYSGSSSHGSSHSSGGGSASSSGNNPKSGNFKGTYPGMKKSIGSTAGDGKGKQGSKYHYPGIPTKTTGQKSGGK